MIKVWTDGAEAGLLDRHETRGSSFAYLPEVACARAVSVTMPVRLPSWTMRFGLPPIFEMNLPEGVLRERLRLAFARASRSVPRPNRRCSRGCRVPSWHPDEPHSLANQGFRTHSIPPRGPPSAQTRPVTNEKTRHLVYRGRRALPILIYKVAPRA